MLKNIDLVEMAIYARENSGELW